MKELRALLENQKTPVKRKRDDATGSSAPIKKRKSNVVLPDKIAKQLFDSGTVMPSGQATRTAGPSNQVAGAKVKKPLPAMPLVPQYLAGVHFCFWETANMSRVIQL